MGCHASAQGFDHIVDFFTMHPNKRQAAADSAIYPAKIIISPVVTYSPETKLALGFGAKGLFKFKGSGEETRTSNMPISVSYTLENQILVYSGFEIFTPQEKYMVKGNIRFQKFPRLFFGLGRDSFSADQENYEFNQILFEPILLKRIPNTYLFVGGGLRYNHISDVEVDSEGLLARGEIEGGLGSTSAGAELAAVYDNRNNLLNAKQGWFVEFTHGFYGNTLGGTQKFQLTRLDVRHYTQPTKDKEDVLALQLVMDMTWGNPPLSELGALGGPELMRGYYEGRFLDRHYIAFQAEYRKQLIGRLGAVAFVGFGDVAPSLKDFEWGNLRFTGGLGLRFLVERKERLNLIFDTGASKERVHYYFNLAEAF